jgi:hypothetical protein
MKFPPSFAQSGLATQNFTTLPLLGFSRQKHPKIGSEAACRLGQ